MHPTVVRWAKKHFEVPLQPTWGKGCEATRNSLLANAIPGSNIEGLDRVKFVVREFLRLKESLRLEAEGIAEVPRAVIRRPLRNAHNSPLWHESAGDICASLRYDTGHAARHGRIAPEGLLDAGKHCGDSRVKFLVVDCASVGTEPREDRWERLGETYCKAGSGRTRNLSHPLI